MLREIWSQFLRRASLEEALDIRRARMIRGAVYGLIAGLAYQFTVATIDSLVHPDLPIVIEWLPAIITATVLGLLLAFIGALTCWFTEWIPGIIIGAAATAMVGLVIQLWAVQAGTMGALLIIFLLLPIAAMSIPLVLCLRWLSDRNLDILGSNLNRFQQGAAFTLLVMGALILGIVPGSFSRMGLSAERSVRLIHSLLQSAPTDPKAAKELHLDQLEGLKEHLEMGYTLKVTNSKISTAGYDVHVRFDDGYTITCVAVAYTSTPYLHSCILGAEVIPPR